MAETQRVAIVTGAAGGIGRAMVRGLLAAGNRVAGVDRDREPMEALAASAREEGKADHLLTLQTDLANDVAAGEITEATRDRFGRIDILVNNAGIGPGAIRPDSWQRPLKFWEITPDQWRRFVAVHTTAPLALPNAVVPEMMRRGWGRIVNVTTSLGQGRDKMDAAVMSYLCRQRGSPPASCAGLQSRQFHANPGDAKDRGAVVADQFAREA